MKQTVDFSQFVPMFRVRFAVRPWMRIQEKA